jgi:CRP/FNR family nitrogen fixation transcriptional regulator
MARERNRESADPLSQIDVLAVTKNCHNGQKIYGQDSAAGDWYRIISGAARKYLLLADGRRRIVDFLLPGDFFGFDIRNSHHFAVESIGESAVTFYPRLRVEALADANPLLGGRIRDVAFEAVSRSQARMLILGRVTAVEKLSSFLAEMVERSAARDTHIVVLPMSRYDIADYLALSVETVSRAMTQLQHCGTITLLGRRCIRIADNRALR